MTPAQPERVSIQQIQSQLARGIMTDEFRGDLAALIAKHARSVDAVVLACTELPLAVRAEDCSVPVLNPTELQCREAFEFATEAA